MSENYSVSTRYNQGQKIETTTTTEQKGDYVRYIKEGLSTTKPQEDGRVVSTTVRRIDPGQVPEGFKEVRQNPSEVKYSQTKVYESDLKSSNRPIERTSYIRSSQTDVKASYTPAATTVSVNQYKPYTREIVNTYSAQKEGGEEEFLEEKVKTASRTHHQPRRVRERENSGDQIVQQGSLDDDDDIEVLEQKKRVHGYVPSGQQQTTTTYTTNSYQQYKNDYSSNYKPITNQYTTNTYTTTTNTTGNNYQPYKPYEPTNTSITKQFEPSSITKKYDPTTISNYRKYEPTTNYQPSSNYSPISKKIDYTPSYPATNTNTYTTTYNTNNTGSYISRPKQQVDKHMKLKQVAEALQQKNQVFTDSEFGPTPNNIGGDFPYAHWKRATEFLRDPQVFVDQIGGSSRAIEPNDIEQGELGDCYFLSTLAALAEFEDNIKKLFPLEVDFDRLKLGLYAAKVCWKGVWQEVLIDNYFPVQSGSPCFTHSKENELWVLILEKVWAKLHGNYCQIDGGLTKEPLHDLTGAPAKTYFTSQHPSDPKYQNVWDRIKHGEQKNFIMTCGSIDYDAPGGDTMEQIHGIAPGHAYSLLAAIELNLNGQNIRLVKLRNPWSAVEWKGKYGDEDPLWNYIPSNVRQQIQFEGRNEKDGIFFMEYNEFVKFFENVQICYHVPHGKYHGIKFNGTQSGTCFRINVPTSGIYYFQVSQKSIRTAPFEIQDYTPTRRFYNKINLIVAPEQEQQKCVVAVSGNQRDLTSFKYVDGEEVLPAGQYLAYVEVEKGQFNETECGFGVYGPSVCDIQQVDSFQLGQFAQLSHQTCSHPQIERY